LTNITETPLAEFPFLFQDLARLDCGFAIAESASRAFLPRDLSVPLEMAMIPSGPNR